MQPPRSSHKTNPSKISSQKSSTDSNIYKENTRSIKKSSSRISQDSREMQKRLLELEKMELKRKYEYDLKLIELEKQHLRNESIRDSDSIRTHTSNRTEPQKVEEWLEKTSIIPDEPVPPHKESIDINNFLMRQSTSKDLPIFAGDPMDWPNFISQFNESTELCKYSKRENMCRLQRCLRGKARDSVEYLLKFPEQLDKVVTVLERRFGRSEYIIEEIVRKISQIPYIKEYQFEALIDFANKVLNLVATIQSLGHHGQFYNTQVLNEMINKLPPILKLQWGAYLNGGEAANLMTFSRWIENVSESVGHVSRPKFNDDRRPKHHEPLPRRTEMNFSTRYGNVRSCSYCENSDHSINKCQSFENLNTTDRWKWVKTKKICFSCLKQNHQIQQCRFKKICGRNDCRKLHNPMLHENQPQPDGMHNRGEPSTSSASCETNLNISNTRNKNVLLRVVPVILTSSTGIQVETYALFDEASTITMIDEDISDELGLHGEIQPLSLQWTNDFSNYIENSKVVSLKISGIANGSKTFTLYQVRTVKNLSLPIQNVDIKGICKRWPYIQNVPVYPLQNAQPTILIGQDNWPLTIPRNRIQKRWNDPVLTKTWLGWVIHGNLPDESNKDKFCYLIKTTHNNDDELHHLVKNSFKIEDIGVRFPEKSNEEIRAEEILEKTTRRVNDLKWETGLLWKYEEFSLPESKNNAFVRLKYIEKKMRQNGTFAEAYKDKIHDYLNKGYAKRLSSEELRIRKKNEWYLPHFAVVNPHKPDKIRVVFDAAAKSNNISLNDMLLAGPDLYNSIISVIWKFRIERIAFSGDVKEMFLQINIRHEDLPAQRFLWRENENEDPGVYEMSVMLFGTVCSPSLAQSVRNKNADEFKDVYPEAANAIKKFHYMDDYLDSCVDEKEAIELINQVIDIHKHAGFSICNWNCNSVDVLKLIPEELRASGNKNMKLNDGDMPCERVLGLQWNPNADEFYFELKFQNMNPEIIAGTCIPTKRELLRITMSIFDPLGFIANVVIHLKIILQKLWKLKLGWDEKLPKDINVQWQKSRKVLLNIAPLKIRRQLFTCSMKKYPVGLHIFADASDKAYSACAYLRIEKEEIETAFLMCKTRVVPLKGVPSIPRLELQAALLASNLYKFIKNNFPLYFSEVHLWSDSQTVIFWIKNDNQKFKQYVANRISQIQEITNINWWHWINTAVNVADEGTKWTKTPVICPESRWLQGPEFLKLPKYKWPEENEKEVYSEDNLEFHHKILIVAPFQKNVALPDLERFSKWLKLIRTTGWIVKYRDKFLHKPTDDDDLSTKYLNEAETLWWIEVQKETFSEEIMMLKRDKEVNKNSKLYALSPFIDEKQVIRMKGRISLVCVADENMKNPVIIPPKHRFTELLVEHFHKEYGHAGQDYIVNQLRQKYWIPNIRHVVKKISRSCLICKKRKCRNEEPMMGDLPEGRLAAYVLPFTHTGMDYFGPLEVTVGRRKEKRYGVIFTCLTIRAVHVELAGSLDTNSAIMAIRRFMSRRGKPVHIYSDNGTNLRGAERELKRAIAEIDQLKMSQELSNRNINWHFIPAAAPHMGGSWERLVRSIKTTLHVILKERAPKEEVLSTLMAEAENIVNGRPLTHISIDPKDMESMTPNHFLIGTNNRMDAPGNFSENDLCSKRQWRIAQALSNMFWKRWLKEYLPTLRKRTKWHAKSEPLKIGDLVLVVDDKNPRNLWPLGMITNVFPGKDGQVRVVDVKIKTTIYRRPTTKICKLNIETTEDSNTDPED